MDLLPDLSRRGNHRVDPVVTATAAAQVATAVEAEAAEATVDTIQVPSLLSVLREIDPL